MDRKNKLTMKERITILLLAISSIVVNAQSLSDLDRAPSFKGITIGAPISKYSSFLRYQGTDNGKNAYLITDSQYLSIFNIKMDKGVILEKDGKVDTIILGKQSSSATFNVNELNVLRSSLSFKYRSPNVSLDDFSSTPTVAGVRWQARTVVIDAVYVFYGTGEPGSGLRYVLYQRNDDY